MRLWPEGTIRGFGILSAILGLTGVWYEIEGFTRHALHGPGLPYETPVFYVEGSLDLLLVLGTIAAAVFLWRVGRAGRVISNVVFISEIVFFLGDAWTSLALDLYGGPKARAIGQSMGAVGGIAHMGTAVQILCGYPFIALIVLNLAYHSLRRRRALEGGGAL